MWPLDLADRITSLPFKEARNLPPNRFRIRAGTGGRVLFNQMHFRYMAVDFWMYAFATGLVQIDSRVLDIGCGCGRFAIVLRRLNHKGWKFSGYYTGVDVDKELIDWCNRHFPDKHFQFIWSDCYNKIYNPSGSRQRRIPIPLESESQDFVFSTSLFTHLLDEDLTAYLGESHRVLRSGKAICMSVFCLDLLKGGAYSPERFRHQIGPAFVADPLRPESAVAYPQAHLERRCREAGFGAVRIDTQGGQPNLIARK